MSSVVVDLSEGTTLPGACGGIRRRDGHNRRGGPKSVRQQPVRPPASPQEHSGREAAGSESGRGAGRANRRDSC